MTEYKVKFVEYGVEFASEPMTEELSDILIKKLNGKGIHNAYKVEISKTF
tara:strand:+ start:86 stop:235 length:150 start_codon:yes stop_codon:yes gene_type:complete